MIVGFRAPGPKWLIFPIAGRDAEALAAVVPTRALRVGRGVTVRAEQGSRLERVAAKAKIHREGNLMQPEGAPLRRPSVVADAASQEVLIAVGGRGGVGAGENGNGGGGGGRFG